VKLCQEVIVWAILGVMAFVAYEAFKAISTRIRDSVNGSVTVRFGTGALHPRHEPHAAARTMAMTPSAQASESMTYSRSARMSGE
jgi:hypothetical protein